MMRFSRYLMVAVLMLAALFGLEISGGVDDGALAQAQAECTVTVQPGESIQAAIDRAPEGAVICLPAGTWEENIVIEKSLTLRGMGAEETVIDGIKEGYPVVWIIGPEEAQTVSVKVEGVTITGAEGRCADMARGVCAHGMLISGKAHATIITNKISGNEWAGIDLGDSAQATITNSTISEHGCGIQLGDSAQATITNSTISEHKWYGIQLGDSAQATITNNTISMNRDGIWLGDSAQAVITGSTISENEDDGIRLGDSAQATIEGNTIVNNRDYGVALYQQPCYDTDAVFEGHVAGRANTIPGPDEPDGNGKGAVCPSPELDFLMTEEGGEYGLL